MVEEIGSLVDMTEADRRDLFLEIKLRFIERMSKRNRNIKNGIVKSSRTGSNSALEDLHLMILLYEQK